jgi:protein subunit release factor B
MRIPQSDEELLAQCEVDTFRSSGPGGQNVNRRETAVRLRHLPSGIVVTCQEERYQLRNRRIALAKLRARLEELAKPVKKRVPTKVPRSVRRRILVAKKRRGRVKDSRKKPSIDE